MALATLPCGPARAAYQGLDECKEPTSGLSYQVGYIEVRFLLHETPYLLAGAVTAILALLGCRPEPVVKHLSDAVREGAGFRIHHCGSSLRTCGMIAVALVPPWAAHLVLDKFFRSG